MRILATRQARPFFERPLIKKSKRLPEWAVFGFLAPNVLGFAVFTFFPVLLSLAMAFTNWSLKPGQTVQAVGLRNFMDLLGVRLLNGGEPSGLIVSVYYLACALSVASIVALIWAFMSGWSGFKLSAAALAGTALSLLLASGFYGGHSQPMAVLCLVLMTLSVAIMAGSSEDAWKLGPGAFPGPLFACSIALIAATRNELWANYELRDPRFWSYLYNTVFMMLGMPFTLLGSLALALLVHKEFPKISSKSKFAGALGCLGAGLACFLGLWVTGFKSTAVLALFFWSIVTLGILFNVVSFRTIFYLPTFTSGVALMVLWKALYNPDSGPINQILHSLSGVPVEELPKWLVSNTWAKPALLFMGIWTGIGGTGMLLYISALSGVSPELIEAAQVDGADAWDRFRHVIWPSLAPTTFFILVMGFIGGLQGGFEQARVMTGGQYETTTLSYYIYNKAYTELDLGYGSATAWVLFAMIFIATAINWRFGKEVEV